MMTQVKQGYISILRHDPCCYCGADVEITIDHIAPRSPGHGMVRGPSGWENMTGACLTCNRAKGNTKLLLFLIQCQTMSPEEFIEAARVKRNARQAAKQAARFFRLGQVYRMAS